MQWLSSEREKRSVVPPSFWYYSIGGALMLLIYAVYKRDIVFTIGQSSGLFIYVRNLQLIRNANKRVARQTAVEGMETISIPATPSVATTDRLRTAA